MNHLLLQIGAMRRLLESPNLSKAAQAVIERHIDRLIAQLYSHY